MFSIVGINIIRSNLISLGTNNNVTAQISTVNRGYVKYYFYQTAHDWYSRALLAFVNNVSTKYKPRDYPVWAHVNTSNNLHTYATDKFSQKFVLVTRDVFVITWVTIITQRVASLCAKFLFLNTSLCSINKFAHVVTKMI